MLKKRIERVWAWTRGNLDVSVDIGQLATLLEIAGRERERASNALTVYQ